MAKQKSIKLNMILSAISSVIGIVMPLITFPYFSRILRPEGLGLYSFLNSFINNFYVFAVLGIGTYGIICCSRVRDDKKELSKTASELYAINLLASFLSYSVLFIMTFFMDKLYDNIGYVIVIALSSITTVLNLNWLVQANEEYVFSTGKNMIINLIVVILLFIFVRSSNDLYLYIYINMGGSIISNFINVIYARRNTKISLRYGMNLKKHLKPILLYFAIALATTIFMDMDKILLGFMLGEAGDYYVGIYEVSSKINRVLVTVISGTVGVLVPRMSYLISNDQEDEFNSIMSKTLTYVFLLAISAVIYMSFFGEKVILAFLGDMYEESISPMLILLPIVVIKSITNITNMYLMAKGKEIHMTIALVIGSIINIIFNVILIPKYKVLGVVIGTLVSEFFVMTYQLIIIRKFIWKVLRKFNLAMIIELLVTTLPITYVCSRFINLNIFADIIISGLIFAVILYIIMLVNKDAYVLKITRKILRIKPKQQTVETNSLINEVSNQNKLIDEVKEEHLVEKKDIE